MSFNSCLKAVAFRIPFFSCKFCKDHGGALERLRKQSCQKLAGVCRRARGAHFSQGGEQALPWEEEHGPDRVFPVADRESRQHGSSSRRRRHYAAQQHLGTGEAGSPPRSSAASSCGRRPLPCDFPCARPEQRTAVPAAKHTATCRTRGFWVLQLWGGTSTREKAFPRLQGRWSATQPK